MYANYQEIREAIARRAEFKGNSCKGFVDSKGIYRIISYATEVYNSQEGLNLTYYSSTTSKLQGIIAELILGKSLKELRKGKEKQPYFAKADKDEGVFKGAKLLEDFIPEGYKISNTYFVDNSGFGSEGEPALTASQFLNKVKKGRAYAIQSEGQFQVNINEFISV